jgi:hypothetical protein
MWQNHLPNSTAHSTADRSSQNATWRGRCALAATIAAVAVVWLAVLPLIGRQPVVSQYILRNERMGIDPAAKFYTELPCMPGVYNRIERSMQRARAAIASPVASPAAAPAR